MSEQSEKRHALVRFARLISLTLVGFAGAAAFWIWTWRESQRAMDVAEATRRFGWSIEGVGGQGPTSLWDPSQGLGSVVRISLREDLSGDEEWRLLTESFPRLTVLHLRGPLCNGQRLAALAKGPPVQEIGLSHCPIDRPLAEALSRMPALESVSLSFSENTPSAEDLLPLADTKSIRSLYFGGALPAGALAHLPPALDTLLLSRTGTTNAELEQLAGAVALRELVLRGLPVSDDGLAVLPKLPALRVLLLGDCQIAGPGLANAAELETLTIIGGPLDDRAVDEICRLPKLKHLDIWNAKLSDQGIERLTQLPNLESLRIKGEQPILTNPQEVGRLRGASPIKQLSLGQ